MGFVALSWLNAVLLLVIVWRGRRENLWSDFRAFYVYAAYSGMQAIAAGGILLTLGIGSPTYRVFYYSGNTLTVFVGAWFFFDTLRCLSSSPDAGARLARNFLLIAVALLLPVFWAVARLDTNPFDRLQAVALAYKMTVCLVAFCYIAEHREIQLGANLGGILTGMALLTGCQCLNFFSYLGGGIQHDLFQILVPSLYCGAMVILLVSLWERDPVVFNLSRREIDLRLNQGFRVFLRSLLPR